MNIVEFLSRERIVPALAAASKEEAIRILVDQICQTHEALRGQESIVWRTLLERERLGSTGVGEGVAIPHAKIATLRALVGGFGRSPEGVAFDAIDGQPARLVFLLLVPENSAGVHLKALARISRLLKNPTFRDELLSAVSGDAIYAAFAREDAAQK